MGFGMSLFLIALGAVLRFAVNVTTKGFNLHTIGVILMVIGAIGLVVSLFWMTVWARRRDGYAVADDRRVADDRVARRPAERI